MTDLIEVKTADLTGAALDWMVAQVEAVPVAIAAPHYGTDWRVYKPDFGGKYSPSTDWAIGGPLIEAWEVTVEPSAWDWKRECVLWRAQINDEANYFEHANPLAAICRAIVAGKLGDIVQVPRELLQ